jgi:hypothetical protein
VKSRGQIGREGRMSSSHPAPACIFFCKPPFDFGLEFNSKE